MEQGPRKATDVLLDLETQVKTLLGLVRSQDLNIKILSNKLNMVMETLEKNTTSKGPSFSIEAIQTANKQIPIDPGKHFEVESDFNMKIDESPNGFRRTSRPESYAGDNSYLPPKSQQSNKLKPPPGRAATPEIIVPPQAPKAKQGLVEPPPFVEPPRAAPRDVNRNAIPVQQRVVDRNGKSIFLADVEIFDLNTNQSIYKTRTNGTGKWAASLSVGNYHVVIQKRESLTKERVKIEQDISVDGTTSLLELQMLIIK